MTDQSDKEVRTTSGTQLRPKRKLVGDTSIAARIERARQQKLREMGLEDPAATIPPPATRPARRANWSRTRTGSGRAAKSGAAPAASQSRNAQTRPPGSAPRPSSRTRPVAPTHSTDQHRIPHKLPHALVHVDNYPYSQKALALRDLEEIKDRFAGRPCFEVRLSWFRYQCGLLRGADAIKAIEQAQGDYAEADADRGHALFILGRILADAGDNRLAMARLEEALRVAPEHGPARVELAKVSRIHETHRLSENSEPETDPGSSWFSRIFTRD